MINLEAEKLYQYIKTLPNFKITTKIDCYDHMGAVVVDGILQAGMNYKNVVKPRVIKILLEYPNNKTTSEFIDICNSVGINTLISWKDSVKPERIISLLQFLKFKKIENTSELRDWLSKSENITEFLKNKGIGKITADYFKILVGSESVKADRHLVKFAQTAQIDFKDIDELKDIVVNCSNLMGIGTSILDYSIWQYMSSKA
jgi:hypothetical protein